MCRRFFLLSLFVLWITACNQPGATLQPSPEPPPSQTATSSPDPTPTPPVSETATEPPQYSCEEWQMWPVLPDVSETAREIYQRGQEGGNNPRAFSRIGDGEISTDWFFTMFDLGEDYYDLGPYPSLAETIAYFQGSFQRRGMAARSGFNTNRILDPALSDPVQCEPGESPLTCELRIHRPAFAILSLGTNQVWRPEEFEMGMREILGILLERNVVPILSTKGDNLEGDHRINRTIACLAQEYDIPLWNFWAAIQPLPAHGLQSDLEHLTYGPPDFDDPRAMQSAWAHRNLTALRALDTVWRGVATVP